MPICWPLHDPPWNTDTTILYLQLSSTHMIILICENVSNSSFIMPSGLSIFISSLYHFLSDLLCGCVKYYLLSIQPKDDLLFFVMSFLLRHCLTLPCLLHFQPPQPLSSANYWCQCWVPRSVPLAPGLPEPSLKLWSPVSSGHTTDMPGPSANTEEKLLASTIYWFKNEIRSSCCGSVG